MTTQHPDADVHLEPGHGNSVAAWTAVSVIALGFLIGAVGVGIAAPWMFYVGVGVAALGLVVGKILSMMGFGVDGSSHAHAADR